MDFTIPEELTALRESFRAFLEREVRPAEQQWDRQLRLGERPDGLRQAADQVTRRSCEEGFYAAHLPESVGGWGLSNLGMALLVEDAGRSGLRLASAALAPPNPAGPTPMLLDLPPHLQDVYLKPLMSGAQTMCFALTEPEAGSDAQSIRTTAVREGDHWVLNGTKHYITNGERADFAVVFAVTDGAKRAQGGITAFVVRREAYQVGRTQHTIADTHPVELVFKDARTPADHVIGEVGYGFSTAMRFLHAGRAYIGAQCLGMAEWCLDQAVAHATSRTTFGKPLGAFQGVSFPLAESKVEVEALRWLIYHLAWSLDEAARTGEAVDMRDSSIVKYFGTERAYWIADRCLQVFGGQGLLKEGPIEAVLRHLRVLRIVEGPSEIQQLVIARSLGLGR